jgi:hypothetical protein
MTRFRIVASVSILSLTLAACVFAYGQGGQDKNKDKPQNKDKHASPGNQPQPQANQHGQQSSRQQKPGNNGQHSGQQKQMERSQEQERDQQRTQVRAWQERRANHWQYERRSWEQRGGYNGYRLPEDYFQDHYGDGHAFRIYSLPFVYEGGNPRFQYGGYWFTMLDPFPENWSGRWYENDDVYVAFKDDGYYLFNRNNPGPHGIAVSVSF